MTARLLVAAWGFTLIAATTIGWHRWLFVTAATSAAIAWTWWGWLTRSVTDTPCLCGHDPHYHSDACQVCACREYQPDDHQYPTGIGWVTS